MILTNQVSLSKHLCFSSTNLKWSIKIFFFFAAEDNPYEARPCPVCNKQISNRANLKKHLKIRHSAQEEATCPYCLKLFRNKYSLWTHINSYHPGVKAQPHHHLQSTPPPPLHIHVQHQQQEYLNPDGSSSSMTSGDNSCMNPADDKYGGPHMQ